MNIVVKCLFVIYHLQEDDVIEDIEDIVQVLLAIFEAIV